MIKLIARDKLLLYLPLMLLPVILFSGTIFSGKALFWGTPALQFIPWRVYALENLRQGILPLWNPLNGMGSPLIANYQTAFFYPPGWLLFLVEAISGTAWMAWAFTFLVIAHLFWAGLGIAKLLKLMGRSVLAQAISGICFGLCGYIVARIGFFSMTFTVAWLPWILLRASRLSAPIPGNSETKTFIPASLVLVISMQLLAGHAQLSWYTLLIVAAWVLIGGWMKHGVAGGLKALSRLACAYLLAGAIAAIQIVPTLEYLVQSQRSSSIDFGYAMNYSFWPWRLITFFAPDFFGNPGMGDYWGYASYWEDAVYLGMLPLILALGTLPVLVLRKGKQINKFQGFGLLIRIMWGFVIISIVFALGKNTPIFPFLYKTIPGFDMFQAPARYLIWTELALCILAGLSIDEWRTPTGRGLYWLRLCTMGGFAVTVGAILGWILLGEVSPTFIRATALAGVWSLGTGLLTLFKPAESQNSRYLAWRWLVIVWVSADLLVAGWMLNPAVDKNFYAQNQINLSNLKGKLNGGRLFLDAKNEYQFKFSRFLRFSDFNPIEKWVDMRSVVLPNLNLLDGISTANNFDPIIPGRYDNWMSKESELSPNGYQNWLKLMNVGLEEKIDIYIPIGVTFEPVSGLGRYRLLSCAVPASSEDEAWGKLKTILISSQEAFLDTVIIEGLPLSSQEDCDGSDPGKFKIISERSDSIKLKISNNQPAWMLVADVWYPGWQASLDGLPAPIYRADYLFRAMQIPPGEHTLELNYRPISFIVGCLFSFVGIIFLIGYKRVSIR